MMDPDILAHYALGMEQSRLEDRLEFARTLLLFQRLLPAPPAQILDIGGGPGCYAEWLSQKGYQVCLIDPVPLHLEQARSLGGFEVELGDARALKQADQSVECVLLMGPLYHLVEKQDRLLALQEARRVLKPGGILLATGVSRFASLLDGLRSNLLTDPEFLEIVQQDLKTGQHRNPELEKHPDWFTTAFFHRPEDLKAEVKEAGFEHVKVRAIQGPIWLFRERWQSEAERPLFFELLEQIEEEPSILGASAHLLASGYCP